MTSEGIGGIAATEKFVIVGSRDVLDTADVFTCHSIEDGSEVWTISYLAEGELDYGNSPRATPLIIDNRVILQGAFGHLMAAELSTGKIVWQKNFQMDFGAELPTWGFCGSPVRIKRKIENGSTRELIIAQPGAADASLAAFDLISGDIVWRSPGKRASYSSFIVARFGNIDQLIGYDESSLGGWDLNGQRLWTVTPEVEGDFNVPTPIQIGDRLFVTTENNGSRLFEFDLKGRILDKPSAHFDDLAPDTHSPVVTSEMICGISDGLYCLDSQTLSKIHFKEDPAFAEYTSIIADGKGRLLVTSFKGELLLVESSRERCEITSRLRLTQGDEIYAHPAVVGNKLIVRFGRDLAYLELVR